jgi:hypothetical protein
MRAFHGSAQVAIDSRLIPFALPFDPSEHVRVNPDRHQLLDRPKKLSHDKLFVTGEFRKIRKIDVFILHPLQCANLFSLIFCKLHKSFNSTSVFSVSQCLRGGFP